MLTGFAAYYLEYSPGAVAADANKAFNDAIIFMTGKGASGDTVGATAWDGTAMQLYLYGLAHQRYYAFRGASGDISFDMESNTTSTHTTYVHWQLMDGEITHCGYFGSDGKHTASATAAWKYFYNEQQSLNDLAEMATDEEVALSYPPPGDQYAVLVQGSTGFSNYRHQADVLSMYQLLRRDGYDDDHIILIIDRDIANDTQNPWPGTIRASENGQDLLGGTDGCPKAQIDYYSDELTPQDISDILCGRQSDKLHTVLPAVSSPLNAMRGRDNVLFYWSGHGSRETYQGDADQFDWRKAGQGKGFTKELMRQTVGQMVFRKLLIIAEPCYSENVISVVEGIPGVLAMSGASGIEQSWAENRCNIGYGFWMCDRFTLNVVNKLSETPAVTYRDFYLYCMQHTMGSHVKIVNAANFGNLYHTNPQEFIVKQ